NLRYFPLFDERGAVAALVRITIRLPAARSATSRSAAPGIGVSPTLSTPKESKTNASKRSVTAPRSSTRSVDVGNDACGRRGRTSWYRLKTQVESTDTLDMTRKYLRDQIKARRCLHISCG